MSGRNRRASGDPTSVGTTPPTFDISFNDHDNDDDDDDDEDDDDFWEDDDSKEFQDPSKKDPSFLKSEQMASIMAGEDQESLSDMGHFFKDMVLSCTYRGVSCR